MIPTPISTLDLYYHGAMCLTPNITSCDGDIPDGTKIIYKSSPNKDCDHPHMLFYYHSDGTLIHKCSEKKVCPSDDGEFLILSSTCGVDASKYSRTKVG